MALDGKAKLVRRHAVAVVADRNQALAAVPQHDVKMRGAGVDGILDKFLGDGGRAFDHFAGGDQVGNVIGENSDLRHNRSSVVSG